jgi:hypothetical protein
MPKKRYEELMAQEEREREQIRKLGCAMRTLGQVSNLWGAFDEGQRPSHFPRCEQQHDRGYEHQSHETE